jgi:hypothetical protein
MHKKSQDKMLQQDEISHQWQGQQATYATRTHKRDWLFRSALLICFAGRVRTLQWGSPAGVGTAGAQATAGIAGDMAQRGNRQAQWP